MNEWRNEYDEYKVIYTPVVMKHVSFELMMDMKRELSEIFNIMKLYWLLIEWFWMMMFVGVSHFEGTLLFINIDWILLFSFHLIDETGWFEELMKKCERYEKWIECFSFHSSLCCLQCLMKWLFQSLCECSQHIHIN